MPKGNVKPYMCAYRENIEAAARDLKPVAFKLYLYFISNQNNYVEAFSSAHFASVYGCDITSAKSAFNTLVEKNYLVLEEGTKTKYVFYETPQEISAPIALPSSLAKNLQKKRFKDEETGEYYEFTFKELVAACEGNEDVAKELWGVN